MQAIRQKGDQSRPGIAADHVKLVGPEHRQYQRVREQQRASRLHQCPHAVSPGVVPAIDANEHRVADLRIEQWLPGGVAEHISRHDSVQRSRCRQVAANHDLVTGHRGGGDHIHDPLIDAKKSEFHLAIVS